MPTTGSAGLMSATRIAAAAAMGAMAMKMLTQLKCSSSQPSTIGPIAMATPAMAPQRPIAQARPTLIPKRPLFHAIDYTAGMLPRSYEGQVCSIARALEVVGERWTLLVIREALTGTRRFEDFRTH